MAEPESTNGQIASPSFSVSDITDSSFRVHVSTVDWTKQYRVFARYSDDTSSSVFDQYYTNSSPFTVTVSGLSPNTSYAVNVCAYTQTEEVWAGAYFLDTAAPPFTRFDWTYAGVNTSGEPMLGSEKEQGLGVYITAKEWNELAELIEKETGSSVSRAAQGDEISAAVVNTAAGALGVGTVTKNVTALSASFFNALREAYNSLAQT